MNLILRNTDRIEMSMAEFIDFTKSVVKEAVAETYGEYISRNEAIRHLGSRKKLEQAIKMKLINPDKGNGNQKWRCLLYTSCLSAYPRVKNALYPLGMPRRLYF